MNKAQRYLAANYSDALCEVLPRQRVAYVKIPTGGSVDAEIGPASELGKPLLLHNAHMNVCLGDPDLRGVLDLDLLAEVIRRTGTPHLSFHLSASALPASPARLVDAAVGNVKWIRAAVELPILVETPCVWADNPDALPFAIPDNLWRILDESGAGLLLDIAHARTSAYFLGWDEDRYLAALPCDRVIEIHAAGSRTFPNAGRLDVHSPLDERDYDLIARLLDSTPAKFVTLEYGGRTACSTEAFCQRFGIERNSPQELEQQLERLAELIES